ncbi:MAG TPA: PucR family transcriptional regulator, partial [Nitrolancea sp.]|nr:PucR family transcriptional regulator [Nitrolancea sp.]
MPEITLRDLCRWERRLALIPPVGVEREAALDRGLSWAVSVRAAPPHLPPLRGEELVVLPLRVLEQLEAGESLTRQELLAELARQPIAAILTEPGFSEEPIDHLPLLTLPAPFPLDAEGTLNRMITERRAELYRLGAELSRRLSQAVADPRGVEALLASAAELAGRDLLLEDTEGNVVAWSGAEQPAPSFALLGAGGARALDGPLLAATDARGREHLIVALSGGPSPGYLSLSGETGKLTEGDRLILTQTAVTCGALLGQSPRRTGGRDGRERLVADLLLGRLASSAAAQARARTLGIDGTQPVVVGLAAAPREADAR